MEFMEKLLTATLNQSVAYFNQDMKISAEIRAENSIETPMFCSNIAP